MPKLRPNPKNHMNLQLVATDRRLTLEASLVSKRRARTALKAARAAPLPLMAPAVIILSVILIIIPITIGLILSLSDVLSLNFNKPAPVTQLTPSLQRLASILRSPLPQQFIGQTLQALPQM